MSEKLEITKEKVLRASKICPEAKEVLTGMFPEAFEKTEEVGRDITKELTFKIDPTGGGAYWIDIYHGTSMIGYIGHHRMTITSHADYVLVQCTDAFKILQKG